MQKLAQEIMPPYLGVRDGTSTVTMAQKMPQALMPGHKMQCLSVSMASDYVFP